MTLRLMAALIPAVVLAAGVGVAAQPQSNPVYVDDSPSAHETFLGIREQLASGNLGGAVRVLQRLLDEEPERLVGAPEDPDLFISVREGVHRTLLATPELLERYRDLEGSKAQRALEAGDAARVEAAWLLTPAGLEAALRLAQEHLESARFDAAWLTLRQLDAHPDRRGEAGRECAAMLGAVAPYLNRTEVWEAAERWSAQASAAAPARRGEPWPLSAARRGQTPLDEGGAMELEGLVAKALWTVPVGTAPPAPVRQVAAPGTEPLPLFATQLRMLPAVAGETVYVNDGETIGAWDRFTLARRWLAGEGSVERPDLEAKRFAQRRTRQVVTEEPNTVTVGGRDLLAITGTADTENRRDGDQRIRLLDADTGRERWSVDPTAGDEQLQGAVLRAAPVLGDGVAVVAARKVNTSRRLTSVYLIGLDRATGRTRWRRLIGSVGALPFGRGSAMLDSVLLHEGVAYLGDQLGVMGAYEAHSGRPVWVRRFDTQSTWLAGESARPWELHVPLADGGSILTVSPDRTEILRIGAADGMVRERRRADAVGVAAPRYLVRAGSLLGVVSENRLALMPMAIFGSAPARSHRFADPGIRGRVVGSDGKVVVPLASGVAEIDTSDPEAVPREVPLESPGNVLAMTSQLLVVDDGRMHSYLLWDAAERVLTERMRAEPDNPMPAVTFAELAYRASRPEHILGAVQAAVAAVDRDPVGEVNAQARRRLFASVLAMVNASQEPPGPATLPGEIRLVDPRLVGALIGQLGALADEAGERASHLLALGRFQESQGRHAQAVETYQQVLDEPPLAAASWTGPQISLRAELEATWRLQRLLAEHGPAVYAAHEAAAEAELAALGPAADAPALERLARRYPVAAMAPRLWLRIADRQRDLGRGQAEVSALEAGLRAASWRTDTEPALVAELGGRLVRALEGQGQLASAAQVLRELTRRRPGLEFQEGTGTLAAATLLEGIEGRLAAKYRWPRVGHVSDEGVQLIQGHSMLRARVPDITPRVGRAIALTDGEAVSVWAEEVGAAGEPGMFVKRWTAPIPGRGVDLVRIENDAAYLFYDTRPGGVLEKVSATEGRSLWRTPPFPDLFPSEGPPGVRRDPEPQPVRTRDGVGLLTDLFVALDERTVTLVERSGRAVGIDAHTGDVLWAQRAPLAPVADTDLRGGTLIVAGDQDLAGGPAGQGAGVASVVLSIDVRTGQVTQRFESRWGQARWLRALDGGSVVVGFDQAIVSVDIERGQTNWVVDDRRVAETKESWVIGDRAFVQDAGGNLWVIAVPNGRLHPQPVRLPPEFRDGYSRLYAAALPRPRRDGDRGADAGGLSERAVVAFSTLAGAVLVSADGEVVAADAIPGNDSVVPPAPAEGLMVTVETDPSGHTEDGLMVFNMHAMEVATGRLKASKGLVLGARPSRLMLMDDRIVVTAGSATVIVRAPAGE